jgi:ubiquinone/menaquinone biosynthesis C-methylase UbiE
MNDENYYHDRVAATYDATSPGLPGDVDFYLDLAREAHADGLPVLELACGTGRVAIPVAREGVRVVGLDRSPQMLAIAREKAAAIKNLRLVEGDMRSFGLDERFGLAFIPYRSFQHLLTVADQLACLGCAREHLAPGGRLALNLFNPSILAIAEWLGSRSGSMQRFADYTHPQSGRQTLRWESRSYQRAAQQLESLRLHEELSDDGAVISRAYRFLKLRYVFRYEMEHLLARAGFEVEAIFGDFYGSAFDDDSSEQVWVARPAG